MATESSVGPLKTGTSFLDGKHTVPDGVAVETLESWSGAEKLEKTCPLEVAKIMADNELQAKYDELVAHIVAESKTRSLISGWKSKEVELVVDGFREAFTEKGVRIAVCKRKSESGKYKWIEFIDVDIAGDYVSQYDVMNLSGAVITTVYCTLTFPRGVAVEEIKNWSGRKRLKEKCPDLVQELLDAKDLSAEYEKLVDAIIEGGVTRHLKSWSSKKINAIVDEHRPAFKAKGVELYMCRKQEYVSHGANGGHNEVFRWIEFVDTAELPSYKPQRDYDDRSTDSCTCQ